MASFFFIIFLFLQYNTYSKTHAQAPLTTVVETYHDHCLCTLGPPMDMITQGLFYLHLYGLSKQMSRPSFYLSLVNLIYCINDYTYKINDAGKQNRNK